MHLALFLALVITLLGSDGASWPGVSQPAARLALAAGGVAALVGLALAASVGTVEALRRDFPQRRQWLRDLDRWQRLVACLWVCVVAGIQFGLDWPGLVRGNWQLGDVVLLDELLILLPVVLPPVLMWAVEFEVDRALRVEGLRETWRLRPMARGRFVCQQARLGWGWTLLPVLAVLGTRDLVQYWAPDVLASRHAPWVFAAPILTIVLIFPGLLRPVWLTHPLAEGSLRRRLESCAARCGVRSARHPGVADRRASGQRRLGRHGSVPALCAGDRRPAGVA